MIALRAAIGVHFRQVSYFWQLADKSHAAPAFLAFAGRLVRSVGRIGLHKPQTTTDINAAWQSFTARKESRAVTDWPSERTADCPQKNQAGVTRACSAVMLDLVDTP
jgi:hypothetical protein